MLKEKRILENKLKTLKKKIKRLEKEKKVLKKTLRSIHIEIGSHEFSSHCKIAG